MPRPAFRAPHLPGGAPLVDRTPPEARAARRRLRACHECDWLCALPPLHAGERADCPRCANPLVRRHRAPAQRSLALAIAALVALGVAASFSFLRFNVRGIGNQIELSEVATTLIGFDEPLVAIAVLLTILVLPATYLVGVIWLQSGLIRGEPLPLSRGIARSLSHLHPWMMADVFIVGALVSLIKISGLAQIELGIAFWAFCTFTVLLLFTTQSLDADWLWFALGGEPRPPEGTRSGEPAAPQGVTGCPTCGLVNRIDAQGRGSCRRCGEPLHVRHRHSLQRTWALLATATVMYVPANLYPIMTTTSLGHSAPSTILGGIVELIEIGSWPVATVIFVASVIVPVGKIVALAWLCLAARHGSDMAAIRCTRLYRLTDFIGRWSMVDVFVVAILVALIRAGTLMAVQPGPAALAFATVVVLTMLAAMTFDPRLLWDPPRRRHRLPDRAEATGTQGEHG